MIIEIFGKILALIPYNEVDHRSVYLIHQPRCVYIQRMKHNLARKRKHMNILNPIDIGFYIYPNPITPPQVGAEGVRMPNLDSK